jgi:hypothetical protein
LTLIPAGGRCHRETVSVTLVFTGALIAGCTYYQTAPGTYATTPGTSFDRSWAAAIGAFKDQGVRITSEDRNAGIVRGTRSGINLTASVRTQADGSVRVEFNTSGATERDPALIDRISRSYDRRMGR